MTHDRRNKEAQYSIKPREIKFSLSTDIVEAHRPKPTQMAFFNISNNPPAPVMVPVDDKCCFGKISKCW